KAIDQTINTVAYFEIQADDPERAVEFYRSVFGWRFAKADGLPIPYWRIETDGIRGGATILITSAFVSGRRRALSHCPRHRERSDRKRSPAKPRVKIVTKLRHISLLLKRVSRPDADDCRQDSAHGGCRRPTI